MNYITSQKIKSSILTFAFAIVVAIGLFFMFNNLGCTPQKKAKTAAIMINIKEITCKTLDYICKYKGFVCDGKLLKIKK